MPCMLGVIRWLHINNLVFIAVSLLKEMIEFAKNVTAVVHSDIIARHVYGL